MSIQDPRMDPAPGDVIRNPFSTHTVISVQDETVHYLDVDHRLHKDSGLRDQVPRWKWRKWYVGDTRSTVIEVGKTP